MNRDATNFKLRFKIWLENENGKAAIGYGKARILVAIKKTGSINAAARELKQPYRNVWAKIREAEKQCGIKLVKTTFTGSSLTPEGQHILRKYTELLRSCTRSTQSKFHQLFGHTHSQAEEPTTSQDTEQE
ncbi:MAG: winged helix-turn-helix domain-containing protein [Desulfomonilaceae bacterium]